jgi:DNA-binding IclR family transcriptional regulator
MSKPSRVIAIINLFTKEQAVWSIDDMSAALAFAKPTTYRYVKELMDEGFLQKTAAGRYALGARFIQIDYQIRRSDPLLLAGSPVMDDLAQELGQSILLSKMYGRQLINIHHVGRPEAELPFPHSRGRPRPLFQGAAPKILLAHLPRPALLRLYAANAGEIAETGMGASWTEFRKLLSRVRKERFYLSIGEVEPDVAAAAVPVLNDDVEAVAALSTAGLTRDLERVGLDKIRTSLTHAARLIQNRLSDLLRQTASG